MSLCGCLSMESANTCLRQAEFGKPSELLKNEKGMLRALVDESGDKDILHAMATGSAGSS